MKLSNRILNKLKRLFSKTQPKVVEVSYEQKRAIIDAYRKKFHLSILVETGTFLGDTIEFFKDKFNELYSIELSAELALRAQKRFSTVEKIQILQGNSSDVLTDLTSSFSQAALFWLDGHYSSEFFHNGEYLITAKADKNTPIERELEILMNSQFENVILVDDARLFVGQNDYPTIKSIRDKIRSCGRKYKVSVSNDIIHIVPY